MDEYQLQHTGAELDTAIQLMLDNGTITPDTPTRVSGLLKGSGGRISPAIAGTDYATPAQVDAKLDKTGGTVSGNLVPDGTRNIGASGNRWDNIYAHRVAVTNTLLCKGDYVVDSGSNDNGNWVKFYDGTMICWHTKDFGLDDVTVPWGSLFEGAEHTFSDFPAAYISKPSVMIGVDIPANLAGYMIEGPKNVTAISPGSFWAYRPNSTAGLRVIVSYIAIGRWK